jgi:hypothetical protein
VSYADQDERNRLIDGLRAVAQFLHDNPDVPAPRWTDVLVFPLDGSDEEKRAEIDVIASRVGVEPREIVSGHYSLVFRTFMAWARSGLRAVSGRFWVLRRG